MTEDPRIKTDVEGRYNALHTSNLESVGYDSLINSKDAA
jgi:hypothetical protein